MTRELNIWSFFRIPVDLAAALRDWPEFVAGEEYTVDLHDRATGETVEIRHYEDWGDEYLIVKASGDGVLFDRVVGRVIRLLSTQSGYLKIRRVPYDDALLFTPQMKRFDAQKNE